MADLLVERRPNGVVLLRLNRPARRNALSTPLLTDIAAALTSADADAAIRAAVITGTVKVFAAGADIDELARSNSNDPIRVFPLVTESRGIPKLENL